MEVEFSASGAITEVVFCRNGAHDIATISGADLVAEADSFQLDLDFAQGAVQEWVVNWGDGNVETVTANQANHVFADGPGQSTIIATAYAADGSVYRSLPLNVQIDNVVPR